MDKYEYSMASTYLYNFVYDDFCSNYLEMSKVALQSDDESYKQIVKSLLVNILKNIIIMIYPFAPFIGEELYLALPTHKKSIMLETFPKVQKYDEKEFVRAYYHPAILHYVWPKPFWRRQRPLFDSEWWAYAEKTGYYNEILNKSPRWIPNGFLLEILYEKNHIYK